MQPSPEAVAWGKRQASGSPRWSEAKWNKIGILLGVQLAADPGADQHDQAAETDPLRDAA
ncbi:hypothetical protein GCM10029978_011670 [Actinoallomurus acanthiterrae]